MENELLYAKVDQLEAAGPLARQDAPPAVPVCASRVSFNQNQAVRFTSRQHNL